MISRRRHVTFYLLWQTLSLNTFLLMCVPFAGHSPNGPPFVLLSSLSRILLNPQSPISLPQSSRSLLFLALYITQGSMPLTSPCWPKPWTFIPPQLVKQLAIPTGRPSTAKLSTIMELDSKFSIEAPFAHSKSKRVSGVNIVGACTPFIAVLPCGRTMTWL